MRVNTALGALAHKSMNISTHIISSGLWSIYVKERRLCCLGRMEIQSLLLCHYTNCIV